MTEIDDDIPSRCIACAEVFQEGDEVFNEKDGGFIHAKCCGPEPEAYFVGDEQRPLFPGEVIPKPFRWTDEPSEFNSEGD